ncbi:hypothetical protein A0U40_13875 [[Bacillus] sp. KCTC 13219]|nr:hypothetical protein A0U40_13875 [[Bacillus] sp. KCTC 13219]
MFQTLKKRIKNEKGLTLIELLAVIVILAIVAAIAVPAIGNIIENSRVNAAKADATNILNAANIYFAGEGSAATTADKDDLQSYVDSWGTFSAATDISVSKVDTGNTFTGTSTLANGKTYTFTAVTLSGIEAVDKEDFTD